MIRTKWGLGCLAVGCAIACAVARPAVGPSAVVARIERLSNDVTPLKYALDWVVMPQEAGFSGRVAITLHNQRATTELELHGIGLEVKEAYALVDGIRVPASYVQLNDDGLSRLTFAETIPTGEVVLHLAFDGAFDKTLTGLYRVEHGGESYAYTQFEPHSARLAFPCFDEPLFKAVFEVTVTTAAGNHVIANAPELSRESLGDGRVRVKFKPTQPLPSYLVALAVGPFDVVTAPELPVSEVRNHPIPFRGIAPKGEGAKLAYALAHTPAMVTELERYFGIAYPFDKLDVIAVPDFAAGAMENAGAITFRDYLLLFDADQAPEYQKRAFSYVMAHELSHQWFGNLVTMAWWDDLWLNEAFATWMGYRVVDRLWPEQQAHLSMLAAGHHAMEEDSLLSARVIRQPIASIHDIADAFDAITYSKGAAVLGMVEQFVGADVFQVGIGAYLRSRPFGSATSRDLVAALGQASGRELAPLFASFLEQPGVPLLTMELRCSPDGAALSWRQRRYFPVGTDAAVQTVASTWLLPVCMRFGHGTTSAERCELLEGASGQWDLEGCPDWVMPNADADGYFLWTLPSSELSKLRKAGLPLLNVRERVALAKNIEAGFSSAELSVPEVMAMMPRLATDRERAVARAPMSVLRFLRDHVATATAQAMIEAHARGLYGPVFDRLGVVGKSKEDGETRMLRANVLHFLAEVGLHAGVRRKLAALGRRFLKARKAKRHAVPSDTLGIALRVAVQDGGRKMSELAYSKFKRTKDPMERARLLAALASVRDGRGPAALALALDPALRVNEVLSVLARQFAHRDTREAAWKFVVDQWPALKARLSARQLSRLPMLSAGFCSKAHAQRLQAFFGPKIVGLGTGPRPLSEAMEALNLCAAKASAHRQGLADYFSIN